MRLQYNHTEIKTTHAILAHYGLGVTLIHTHYIHEASKSWQGKMRSLCDVFTDLLMLILAFFHSIGILN